MRAGFLPSPAPLSRVCILIRTVRIGQDEVKIFIETFLRFGWGKPAVYPRLPRGLGVIIQVEDSILKT